MNRTTKKLSPATVREILEILGQTYPEAHCELNFDTPFHLLVSTILSAQCTDQRVNQVTARLFRTYRNPEDFLRLGQAGLEEEIRECGLFRNKAKNILATCEILVNKYGGEVPSTLEALNALPGVGRKTANVVGSNAFGIPAIAVDTHVFRVSNRLGLAEADTVDKVEAQLRERIPRQQWIKAHHWLIWHGRRICQARHPKCEICLLNTHCRYLKT